MFKLRTLLAVGALLTVSLCLWALWPCSSNIPAQVAHPVVHVKLQAGVQAFAAPLDHATAVPLFGRSAAELAADRNKALALGATDTPDLSAWYRIDNSANPEALVERLLHRSDVETAFIAPTPELALLQVESRAGDRCPINTPTYDEMQGYLSEAPDGIHAAAAWALPGGRGKNVSFADIEGGWNVAHEDLPKERIKHVAGRQVRDRGWVAHGTAVVGVVASKDNRLGMVGIAPDVAKIFTASYQRIGVAAAIDRAQAKLKRGDVLLIELHAIGPRRRFMPMEYWDDVYDVVKVATDRGIVVVAAAGNGGENLDHRAYERRFDSSFRDSGAILVGAGAPPRPGFVPRSRLDFSNYGARVDVQGWGYKVASLDYGDLQDCGSPHVRKYTAEFAGTSSASPIVTGSALLLQSIHKERHQGEVLSPKALRALLRRTGSAQADGPEGPASEQHIGSLPNLSAAIAELP